VLKFGRGVAFVRCGKYSGLTVDCNVVGDGVGMYCSNEMGLFDWCGRRREYGCGVFLQNSMKGAWLLGVSAGRKRTDGVSTVILSFAF